MAVSTNAYNRGWGPGWPVNRSRDMVTVTGGDIKLSVHRGIARLVQWLLDETVRLGYRLDAVPDDWGYAFRPIRGSNVPSNHSWGLAVDLNAVANPMGSKLITNIPADVVALWKSKGFRWGGEYHSRPDAMHFEFMGTPADAAAYTGNLGYHSQQDPRPPVVTPPPVQNATPPPPPPAPTPEGQNMFKETTICKFDDGKAYIFYPSGFRSECSDQHHIDVLRYNGMRYQEVHDLATYLIMIDHTAPLPKAG